MEGEFRGEFIRKGQGVGENGRQGKAGGGGDKESLKNISHSPSHQAHFNVFIETD